MRTTQLRDYTIQPGQLDRFAELWSRGVRPLREKRGFTIEAAWKIPTEDRFVWVLSYEGADGWDAANHAYYESAERKALDPDPATLIAKQRTAFIERV